MKWLDRTWIFLQLFSSHFFILMMLKRDRAVERWDKNILHFSTNWTLGTIRVNMKKCLHTILYKIERIQGESFAIYRFFFFTKYSFASMLIAHHWRMTIYSKSIWNKNGTLSPNHAWLGSRNKSKLPYTVR